MDIPEESIFEWQPVTALTVEPYDGQVLNLQVDEPSACYVAEGIVVHNCPHELEVRRVQVTGPVNCGNLWRGGSGFTPADIVSAVDIGAAVI